MRITHKLLAILIFLGIFPLVLSSIIIHNKSSSALYQRLHMDAETITKKLMYDFERLTQTVLLNLNVLAATSALQKGLSVKPADRERSGTDSWLGTMAAAESNIEGYAVVDLKGSVVFQSE